MSPGNQGDVSIAMIEAERIDTKRTDIGVIDVGEIDTMIDAKKIDTGIMIVVVEGIAAITKFNSPC